MEETRDAEEPGGEAQEDRGRRPPGGAPGVEAHPPEVEAPGNQERRDPQGPRHRADRDELKYK